ncbi:excinuclease ABC subunit UvrA [Patescibacteria group bacterium]
MPSNKSKKEEIIIRGARVNNLKNVNLDIPKNKLVVVTGLSGSGKSSLAFDTIFAEGNRRYMEGLSSYARSFLDISAKPDVDKIDNISPPIAIDQRSVVRSPRSTVGTMTEVYDYLRVLFSKIGGVHCPDCNNEMKRKSNREILKKILKFEDRTQIMILARYYDSKSAPVDTLKRIQQLGYARVRFNEKVKAIDDAIPLIRDGVDTDIDVVVDRITLSSKNPDDERILDSIETAMKLGSGSMVVLVDNIDEMTFNNDFICHSCGVRIKEVTPNKFSFNSPEGACSECSGLGVKMNVSPKFIIPNKKLSIIEGAIKPWSKLGSKSDDNAQLRSLQSLARKYKFSLNAPISKLSNKALEAILHGECSDSKIQFKGVVRELEEKYASTRSDHARKEIEKYMFSSTCSSCEGKRLKREYLSVLIKGKSIDDIVIMSISEAREFFDTFSFAEIDSDFEKVASVLIDEILERLNALENVGLNYLSLSRSTQTISGGEAQRIRLAVQIKSQLSGIIYVLDEPSIGLHSRDTEKLIKTVNSLKDAGNSLIIVEHDRDFMKAADWIIDMGPGAGEEGGKVIFEGTPDDLEKSGNITGRHVFEKEDVFSKSKYRAGSGKSISIIGATENNLKKVDVSIPLGKIITVAGVSGSGKSTLVNDILAKALSKHFYNAKREPGEHKEINGVSNIDKVINITQAPIGKTPRSNAATYTGTFSHIRELFSRTEESKNRGYTASRFSFNMKGGRCEVCQGDGKRKIEMQLLPDMYVKCEACEGTRYNKKTLEIEYRGVNIANVLEMSVSYASKFFKEHPLIHDKLRTMEEVGLGYLKLGQSATDLSGGEAQRIKLATELARKSTGKTLYILDEPTIGLHFEDTKKLLKVCDALVEKGNTVLIVEHNTDVMKSSDWIIELGHEGGDGGGEVVFEGTPKQLQKDKKSWTAKYI